jgi:hypothetical protein
LNGLMMASIFFMLPLAARLGMETLCRRLRKPWPATELLGWLPSEGFECVSR